MQKRLEWGLPHLLSWNGATIRSYELTSPNLQSCPTLDIIFNGTILASVTSKKLQNVYKSCPKMISLIKLKILTPLQKLPKNVGDLGNSILAKGFEKVAQSPINHPIWSHWSWPPFRLFSAFFKQTLPQSLQQKMWKFSIDCTLLGFEPTTWRYIIFGICETLNCG